MLRSILAWRIVCLWVIVAACSCALEMGSERWETAPSPPAVRWTGAGAHPLDDDARTGWIEVPFPEQTRYVALRVTALPVPFADEACLRIEPLLRGDGELLIDEAMAHEPGAVCTACTQRAMATPGYALHVFPNDGCPLAGPDTLRFRVQLRDCLAGVAAAPDATPVPERVRVEYAHEPEVDDGRTGRLALRVAVAKGSALALGPLMDDPLWRTAWERISALYAAAGVELALERTAIVDAPEGDLLIFAPGRMEALDALTDAARAALSDGPGDDRFVPLVLVAGLRRESPLGGPTELLGHTPRIPGGASPGASASAVLIAVGADDVDGVRSRPEAAVLAGVLAHELGHHLGLFHDDSPAARHLGPETPGNVMRSGYPTLGEGDGGDTAGLTPAQRDVVRRHPDVWYP